MFNVTTVVFDVSLGSTAAAAALKLWRPGMRLRCWSSISLESGELDGAEVILICSPTSERADLIQRGLAALRERKAKVRGVFGLSEYPMRVVASLGLETRNLVFQPSRTTEGLLRQVGVDDLQIKQLLSLAVLDWPELSLLERKMLRDTVPEWLAVQAWMHSVIRSCRGGREPSLQEEGRAAILLAHRLTVSLWPDAELSSMALAGSLLEVRTAHLVYDAVNHGYGILSVLLPDTEISFHDLLFPEGTLLQSCLAARGAWILMVRQHGHPPIIVCPNETLRRQLQEVCAEFLASGKCEEDQTMQAIRRIVEQLRKAN